jgi:hypothetical protein
MSANGTNGTPRLTRRDLREAAVSAAVERERLRAYTRRLLLERYFTADDDWSCADLWRETRGAYCDVPGNLPSDRRGGANWPVWRDQGDLDRIRQKARVVCETNPYAVGLLENLVNHLVGKGFAYKFLTKENTPDSDPDRAARADALKRLVAKAQDELDRAWRRNRWNGKPGRQAAPGQTREQEICRRLFRDGEVFLRYIVEDGRLKVRYLEPEQIRTPPGGEYRDGWSFGIKGDPKDAEDVQAYHAVWVDPTVIALLGDDPDGEDIDAAEIEHLKGPRTDSTIRRGVSAFAFGVAAALERARVLGRNTSVAAQVKAAIAETWQHANGTEAEVSTFRSGQRDHQEEYTTADGETKTRNVDVRHPGTVRDIPQGMEAVYPAPDNAAVYLQVLQADLRAACAAFAAPEYFTADASNGTYAGLKEASAPFVKFAEAYQVYLAAAFARVAWKVIEVAVEAGRLPREVLTLLDLQVEGPTVYQRDRLQVAQESQIYNLLGVWSPQTIAMETGKDYEVEAANIEQHWARFGDAGAPLGMPGAETGGMPELPGLTPGLQDDAGGALHESILEGPGTCKKGETAKQTRCVPAAGDAKAPDGKGDEKPSGKASSRNLGRFSRKSDDIFESAESCAQCGPGCDCEHCRAKQGQPLLETARVLDVPDERQDEGWSCILPGQEIQGRIRGASKAWYAGQVVELRTMSGAVLSVTANHPVLTMKGFVPAGQLKEGQNLLRYVGEDQSAALRDNEQHAPTVAEEVFRALGDIAGPILSGEFTSRRFEFHGDAEFFKGKVQVVGSYSQLRGNVVPKAPQNIAQSRFVGLHVQEVSLSSGGPSGRCFNRAWLAEGGRVRGLGLGASRAFVHAVPHQSPRRSPPSKGNLSSKECASEGLFADTVLAGQTLQGFSAGVSLNEGIKVGYLGSMLQPPFLASTAKRLGVFPVCKAARFGQGSQLDTALAECVGEPGAADARLAGKLLDRNPGKVALDKIVEIRKRHYEGPVYDFESPLGWIIAGNLLISNCGAAVVTSVARFFGVEPNTEPEAVLALGSSPRDGTDPEKILAVLEGAGLSTTALAGMDLETLEYFVSRGRPVICCIQAWPASPEEVERLESGHWIVVIGADAETISVMDPARFSPDELAGYGVSLSGQRVAVPREEFLRRWVDVDSEGAEYRNYGIAIRKP